MTAHTDVQIINGPNGAPAYVVIPYADYIASHPESDLIPHDVVGMVVNDGLTMVAAWRKYLGKTQAEVANAIGVSQSAYAQMETSNRPRKATLEKISAALGVNVDQLSE
ncbi:helix-turn-helix transcriptional regulator [Halomonas sp. SpR1]|uniref:helix-turn-helix domain-containing protein n=1 Tax=Halomonas sp. SpR1 TaxID=3050462 RepID=UPI0027E465E3|nr:helix-turn-helix transcriptional regulator [Halomonas sp. SpR1]MDQ7731610.1 helix-turn-helix transcriptional regulator [Halomonas sp. SpR1]